MKETQHGKSIFGRRKWYSFEANQDSDLILEMIIRPLYVVSPESHRPGNVVSETEINYWVLMTSLPRGFLTTR